MKILICDVCKTDQNVTTCIDPYMKNMFDEEYKVELCEKCYLDKVLSI